MDSVKGLLVSFNMWTLYKIGNYLWDYLCFSVFLLSLCFCLELHLVKKIQSSEMENKKTKPSGLDCL